MKEREPKLNEKAYDAICFVCDHQIGKRPWVYVGYEKFRHQNRCEPLGENWKEKFPDSLSAQLQKRKEEEMARKEKDVMEVLVEAAEELNEVLGIEPPIDIEAGEEKLKELLKEAAKLLTEDDEISEGTQKALETLEGEMKTKGKAVEEVKKGKAVEEVKKGKAVEKEVAASEEKTKFGHRKDSVAGYVDEAILRGESLIQIAKDLIKKFHKPEMIALMFTGTHARMLANKHGVKFEDYEGSGRK